MFKKTTFALAVSGLLGASTAQAALVYDQDGTTLDIYGRIAMGFEGGGAKNGVDNGEEFRDFGSRLGFTAGHQISSDLRAFARVEWRFSGDERNTSSGFNEVRNSYLGLESQQFGTLMAGNFDSFYDEYVFGNPFDIYVELDYEFAGGGTQARGDSIGYKTPEINGFQAVFSAKHFSERGLTVAEQTSEGSVIATQGGVVYTTGPARFAVGFAEDTVRGGGNGENRYGATASYEISDTTSVRLGYETRDDGNTFGGGFETIAVGTSYATGAWVFHLDYYNIDPDNASGSRNSWGAATHYDLSNNFDVFIEIKDADQDAVNDFEDDIYYAVGARYHF